MKSRAERFGASSMSEEAKIAARKMRFAGTASLESLMKEGKIGSNNNNKDADKGPKSAKKQAPSLSPEELKAMQERASRFGATTSKVLKKVEKQAVKEAIKAQLDERAKRFQSS